MIIAVDAMGGDYAPAEIVKGAAVGSEAYGVEVVLVGDEAGIKRHLPSRFLDSGRVRIHPASEVIAMDDHVDAVRTKKDASVVVAATLVKEGRADAMVSLGNTAAAMAVATLKFGRITGIDRPAIAIIVPGVRGPSVFLDAGAVADCEPENLRQFAIMGSIYARTALGIERPRVALLSIGEEKEKGSRLTRAAYELLEKDSLNFIGNIESRHLMSNEADVIVADGFAGNIALKTAEGLAEHVAHLFMDDLRKHPLAWAPLVMLGPMFKRIKKRLDYSEYGGAPLLGLSGICIIGHGRSKARAAASAVRAAREAVAGGLVAAIEESVTRNG